MDIAPVPAQTRNDRRAPLSVPAAPVQNVRQQTRDPHFGYEQLRCALIHHDERAWQLVYHHYQGQVWYWVKKQIRFQVDETTIQTLVHDAFVKMAGTFTRHPEKFTNYPNLAALLGLLRLCAQRVVQDYVTDLQQTISVVALEAIDEPASAPMPALSDLWRMLEGLLHDEKEWLVVTRVLIEEIKPRHLHVEHPGLFQTVDEINTIRERVKGRLQRNQAFRHELQAMVAQ